MIPRFRAWDKETKTMNGMAEIYRNRNQEIELHPRDENIILMQSTGLFDKNGKEIFEGDIIDTTDYEGGLSSVGNPLVKVERDKYGFVVTGDFPDSPITLKQFEDGRKFAGVEVVVVGNILENGDLLEADNDRD